ncbi:MAG: glgB [Parachlamydiales bacterium]|nr:glgB [Parachlamydiales bacterium]
MKSLADNISFNGEHHDPHQILGRHRTIRLWRPDAKEVFVEIAHRIIAADRVTEEGLFEVKVSESLRFMDYRVYHSSGLLAHDPYAFSPVLGEIDLYLFNKGVHYDLYQVLGAHLRAHQGVAGAQFAVWAPGAKNVALVGDFNRWDGRTNPMRSLGTSGIWELFVPGLAPNEKYKFEIRTPDGHLRLKSDPYGYAFELRPQNSSIVCDISRFEWGDQEWIEQRRKNDLNRPMNIYELHIGSWRNYGEEFPNYRIVAHDLAAYCRTMGFTHVELLPVMEHPLDESWGYQVTGFFAPTSRYGTPEDFQYFVDHLHRMGIGVILDWVPAHFPTDDFSLNRFDGTALYEHEDPRQGIHPHWYTAIFNYGRKEVTNFLLASALFWFDQMHIDGLRVDAVASMLYLDYGRKAGEWIPNCFGGNHNLEAIEFIKHLNSIVHQRFPGALMIAEESSAFTGVSHPEGLGFDLKWNMGWMNDTLRYFSKDPVFRRHHQNDLTFSLLYTFSEKFLLVLSHDEVVHMKNSLLSKMPGSEWQKFANLRLLYSYMICHPGKKLIFMGGEIAQWNEWDCKSTIHWYLMQYPLHLGMHDMVRDLNQLYLQHPELWGQDFDWAGYEWIDFSDADRSTISYLRKSDGKYLACVHNFTPETVENYLIKLSHLEQVREVFNTDAAKYGGSNRINSEIKIVKNSGFMIALSPLATMIFEVDFV